MVWRGRISVETATLVAAEKYLVMTNATMSVMISSTINTGHTMMVDEEQRPSGSICKQGCKSESIEERSAPSLLTSCPRKHLVALDM